MKIGKYRRKVVGILACAWLVACASLPAPERSGQTPPVAASSDGRQRLALLVGISQYPQTSPAPWRPLNTHRDLTDLHDVLKARYKFREEDILLLEDQAATGAGIRAAFQSHLLGKARPGAVVVFHFSGHGQQVLDDNHDESDGLDETLVPAESNDQRAASGARVNLRDDEIGQWLSDLQAKLRGQSGRVEGSINVFLDSCHSGTATRGDLVERGRGWDERPEMDGPRPQPAIVERSGALSMRDADGEYILLSAAQSDQTAKEVAGMGAFTRALVVALKRASAQTTYRALLDDIVVQVHGAVRNQTPQFEGAFDQYLFGGAAPPATPYARIESVSGDEILLGVGELHLVSVGSLYDLHRKGAETTGPATWLGQAEVIAVEPERSRLRLRPGPGGRKPSTTDLWAARAIEIKHSYQDRKLRVWLDGPLDPRLAQSIQVLPLVTMQGVGKDSYDVKLTKKGDHIELYQPESGCPLAKVALTADAPDVVQTKLTQHLQSEWRWRQLYGLKQENADVRAELRLVPVHARLDAHGHPTTAPTPRANLAPGPPRIKDGEHFLLELRNPTSFPLSVTVLELGPSGQIDVLFPKAGQAGDALIAPGTFVVPWQRYLFETERPLGPYLYKVIATRQPVDLQHLVQRASELGRGRGMTFERAEGLAALEAGIRSVPGEISPLIHLLLTAAAGAERSKNISLPIGTWGVTEASLEVTAEPAGSLKNKDVCSP